MIPKPVCVAVSYLPSRVLEAHTLLHNFLHFACHSKIYQQNSKLELTLNFKNKKFSIMAA